TGGSGSLPDRSEARDSRRLVHSGPGSPSSRRPQMTRRGDQLPPGVADTTGNDVFVSTLEAFLARRRDHGTSARAAPPSSPRPAPFGAQHGAGSAVASAVYSDGVRASKTWDHGYTSQGISVALIAPGINPGGDLAGKVVGSVDRTSEANIVDSDGHGTFVAGL